MITTETYNKINSACCWIGVFLKDESISTGTGFSAAPDGLVITAAHVITGRLPIREEDYRDPDQKILCKFPGHEVQEYLVAYCGINVEGKFFEKPLQIDLAFLVPKNPIGSNFPYLPTLTSPPQLGEEVLMAGFSDELALPFNFTSHLSSSLKGMPDFLKAMENGYTADMGGLIIKRGHVANSKCIIAEDDSRNEKIECQIMYIDNGMHSGASGGPLVSAAGEVVGVIVERSITSASQDESPTLKVPAGSTVALGLQPLITISKRTGGYAT
jgi:S1-C subfamily serine protease